MVVKPTFPGRYRQTTISQRAYWFLTDKGSKVNCWLAARIQSLDFLKRQAPPLALLPPVIEAKI